MYRQVAGEVRETGGFSRPSLDQASVATEMVGARLWPGRGVVCVSESVSMQESALLASTTITQAGSSQVVKSNKRKKRGRVKRGKSKREARGRHRSKGKTVQRCGEQDNNKAAAELSETTVNHTLQETMQFEHTLLRVLARVNGEDVVVLIDAGASHDFISKPLARRLRLPTTAAGRMNLRFGDGRNVSQHVTQSRSVKLEMDTWTESREFLVVPNLNHELILGKPWLTKWQPQINWQTNIVTLINQGIQHDIDATHPSAESDLQFISAIQANKMLKKGQEAFVVWVFNTELRETLQQCRIETQDAAETERMQQLLAEYEDCMPEKVDSLPPKRHIEHRIDVIPGATPPHRKPFRLSQPQMVELKMVLQRSSNSFRGTEKPASQQRRRKQCWQT